MSNTAPAIQGPAPVQVAIAMFTVIVATLSVNIAANVVSPANDFSNMWPRRIDFKTGGLITGVIGILMMPWKLLADPSGYIFTWLVGYSGLLGPIGGIMIADYFVYRRRSLSLYALYDPAGAHRYTNGFSLVALAALAAGILPSIPGFLVAIKVAGATVFPATLVHLYDYAWFVGFGVAFVVYLAMRKLAPNA